MPHALVELALQNGPDAIRVVDAAGNVLDVVGYGGLDDATHSESMGAAAVDAGESIARTPDGRDTGDNSRDFVAATPTPSGWNVARHDAGVVLAAGTSARAGRERAGVERIALDISNHGLADIAAGAVAIEMRDSSSAGVIVGAPAYNAATIAPGTLARVIVEILLSQPGYHWIDLTLRYAGDERADNDGVAVVRRVGRPRVLVSEIMSAPRDGCPQFVELYNAGPDPVDLTGYSLRDMRSAPARIGAESLLVAARSFVVVSDDAALLRACARVDAHDVAGTWPSFNKSGSAFADSIVVTDAFGIVVDAVSYPGVKTGTVGRSLERIDLFGADAPRDAVWRLSSDDGGSPGRPGEGSLETPPRAGCEVSPNPFMPTDGDLMRVVVVPSSGVERVVVRIYDTRGRRVCDMGAADTFPAVLLWDGRRDGGDIVRAGIYVLACETFDAAGVRVGVEKVVVGCASRSP
jgi:hypothetical protein